MKGMSYAPPPLHFSAVELHPNKTAERVPSKSTPDLIKELAAKEGENAYWVHKKDYSDADENGGNISLVTSNSLSGYPESDGWVRDIGYTPQGKELRHNY